MYISLFVIIFARDTDGGREETGREEEGKCQRKRNGIPLIHHFNYSVATPLNAGGFFNKLIHMFLPNSI